MLGAFKEALETMDFTDVRVKGHWTNVVYVMVGQPRSAGSDRKTELTKALGASVLTRWESIKRVVCRSRNKQGLFLRKIQPVHRAGRK